VSARPDPRAPAPRREVYDDAELDARAEERAERRLFWRQLAILVVIAAVVAVRVWLV
jgi:hypothetical protein